MGEAHVLFTRPVPNLHLPRAAVHATYCPRRVSLCKQSNKLGCGLSGALDVKCFYSFVDALMKTRLGESM